MAFTVIAHLKIYQISFVKVWITKIIRCLIRLYSYTWFYRKSWVNFRHFHRCSYFYRTKHIIHLYKKYDIYTTVRIHFYTWATIVTYSWYLVIIFFQNSWVFKSWHQFFLRRLIGFLSSPMINVTTYCTFCWLRQIITE